MVVVATRTPQVVRDGDERGVVVVATDAARTHEKPALVARHRRYVEHQRGHQQYA